MNIELKKSVFQANLDLQSNDLVILTWGNVSGRIEGERDFIIKPSGVPYEDMRCEDMVLVNEHGETLAAGLRPSSDTPTHALLYRRYPMLGGIVHTHSTYATAWAQAAQGVPCYGTTHADYFYGEIPCTRYLTNEEIAGEYEVATGEVIVEALAGCDPLSMPGILVAGHGPFAWGATPQEAVHNAVVLEQICKLATLTRQINPQSIAVSQELLDKHYLRKHGVDAYYGQG